LQSYLAGSAADEQVFRRLANFTPAKIAPDAFGAFIHALLLLTNAPSHLKIAALFCPVEDMTNGVTRYLQFATICD
jgi:hypothetical protein